MSRRLPVLGFALITAFGLASVTQVATAQDGADRPTRMSDSIRRAALQNPLQMIEALLDRVAEVERQMARLRIEVAEANLARSRAERELAELRQFINDNNQLADDFAQYHGVKEIAERDQRDQQREEARAAMEEARAQRDARRKAALAELDRQNAESDRLRGYREAGFSQLGLDVFASRMAFHYDGEIHTPSRLDYESGFGRYRRYYPPVETVDYTEMTISGSIMNAADTVRNLGVAIVFFDENGNQVGQHIVQVNNARPNIPYPFTADLDMALNRPFASSSTYVLYADAAEPTEDTTFETWERSPESPYARVK